VNATVVEDSVDQRLAGVDDVMAARDEPAAVVLPGDGSGGVPGGTAGAHPAYDEDGLKPRLRGVLHAAMVLLVIAGGVALIMLSRGWPQRVACVVDMLCALQLFGVSAVYHLGNWKQRPDKVLQQLDHSNIFIFIAGTYTPLAVGVLRGAPMVVLLALIWGVAVLGVALGVFALRAPRWLSAGLYVAMGWIAVGWMPLLWMRGGPAIPLLVLIGGVIYTGGAIVYARKRPNPAPAWFGFHEVFHACTVVAAICHWAAIALAVR
jgi:hemolysin III